MRKTIIWGVFFFLLGIALISTIYIFLYGENSRNIRFLSSYGWVVENSPVECAEIEIPAVFDEVYENYNVLQKEAGLDIEKYAGRKATRYTYILKNFPYEVGSQVRANVVCVDKKPVAGDIMTVSANGFMYSLNFNERVCFSAKN